MEKQEDVIKTVVTLMKKNLKDVGDMSTDEIIARVFFDALDQECSSTAAFILQHGIDKLAAIWDSLEIPHA